MIINGIIAFVRMRPFSIHGIIPNTKKTPLVIALSKLYRPVEPSTVMLKIDPCFCKMGKQMPGMFLGSVPHYGTKAQKGV
jgi:hypothetical protein